MKKYLLALLLLSACCENGTESDCTVAEAKQIKESREPWLLTEKEGVKIWGIKPCSGCYSVYFSTSANGCSGTVNWTEPSGKTSVPRYFTGNGCAKPTYDELQLELQREDNDRMHGGAR